MSRKSDFRRLFRESFTVDSKWAEWFMSEVYTDDEALVLDVDGKAVSTMLLSPYPFAFHGSELPATYISCVATARSERGKGLMHRLFPAALNEAVERGGAIATLIPASRRLYFFYDHFGFSTVFYANEMRYTALHSFTMSEAFAETTPGYELFSQLEESLPCGIRHDRRRFEQVCSDYRLSDGVIVAVTDPEGHGAMAFVQNGKQQAKVDVLLSDSDEAAEAALAAMRGHIGEKPVVVMGLPEDAERDFAAEPLAGIGCHPPLVARGMGRIINAGMVLSALAAAHPDLEQVVRVRDRLISTNNSIFSLHKGECDPTPDTMRRVTLDVDISTLTKILFSPPSIGEIFHLPTLRPQMALMLE